jgi:hypothetical protein
VNYTKCNKRLEVVRAASLLVPRIIIDLISAWLILVLAVETISSVVLAMILLSFTVSSFFVWTLRMTNVLSVATHDASKIVA